LLIAQMAARAAANRTQWQVLIARPLRIEITDRFSASIISSTAGWEPAREAKAAGPRLTYHGLALSALEVVDAVRLPATPRRWIRGASVLELFAHLLHFTLHLLNLPA
jgi:hypothetical protein